MDDTAAKLDQIEAVLRALSGGSDGVLEVRSRYSRDGDHTNPSHRWTTVVRSDISTFNEVNLFMHSD